MAYTKTKELKNLIDEAIDKGVTSKKTLAACLKTILACESRIKSMREAITDLDFRIKKAYAKSVSYVQDQFTETVEKDGIFVTNIDLGEEGKFKMTRSKDKLGRIDESNLTQGFLKGLPPAWTREKLELNTTAINNLMITEKELKKHELVRKDKFAFSVKTEKSEDVD